MMRQRLRELQETCDRLQVEGISFGQTAYQSDLNVLICVVQELLGMVERLAPAEPEANGEFRSHAADCDPRV